MKNWITLFIVSFFSFIIQAQTDIYEAARTGDTTVIQELYTLNSDTVNAKNQVGHSPLILAAYHNQVEAVKLLIALGADVNYHFEQGSALHGAAFKGHSEVVKILVKHGVKLNVPDYNGSTPLIYATIFNHTNIAILLYAKGADAKHQDKTGKSANDYAIELKNEKLVELFNIETN